ncbi:MAG: TDP-N-acetylfucosamine:lipid II N-acetylfucosaminyltransferase [Chitinophagaceae bacterium]|nr:TDP-N-acetylfucosamine:lipid II N-acetylfucosaminyltransferase [Chitinophagaceae bacterium]
MKTEINILHVLDDKKFISYCKNTFSLPYLRNTITESVNLSSTILDHSFDIIIFHSLRNESVKVLNSVSISQPVIWFFWGADGFCLGKFYNLFLLPKTKRSRLRLAFKNSLGNGLKTLYKSLFPQSIDKKPYYRNLIKSFGKISIIVPIVPGDFELLQEKYTLKASSFHLNYVSPIFDHSIDLSITGDNILIGNSAHFTNNHIEIIDILSKMNLGNRKVIVPLSYGNRANSRFIASYAIKKLPQNAICLTEFLSFEEYLKIVQSCSIVIMNHLRQQALGNIIQSLAIGVKLYLQPSSSLYKYLKDNQFIIYTIEELKNTKPLSAQEQEHNRAKCMELFGKELQHTKVKQLIEQALSQDFRENIIVKNAPFSNY